MGFKQFVLALAVLVSAGTAIHSGTARAEDAGAPSQQKIMEVKSNTVNGAYYFYVNLDGNGDLMTLSYTGPLHSRTLTLSAVNSVDSDDHHLGQLILEHKGYKVMYLKGQGVTAAAGGRIKMSYLTNGITGNYDDIELYVAREGGRWVLTNVSTGKTITGMYLKKGMVGLHEPTFYDAQL